MGTKLGAHEARRVTRCAIGLCAGTFGTTESVIEVRGDPANDTDDLQLANRQKQDLPDFMIWRDWGISIM